MKNLRNVVPLISVVFFCTLSMATSAQARESCHAINAKGVGQDLGEGQTEAQILGGGLLHGTTAGNFAITGFSGTVASIAGTVKFTTKHGTLTVDVTGTLDTATGEFNASGPVSDATGKLAGATGNLALSGVENLSDGSFVEEVTGEICVDLAP
jgi:hypothetical protein